jgi:putative DNA primase/helicase
MIQTVSKSDPPASDLDTLVAALEAAGCEVRGRSVVCAFHGDRNASGSIYEGEDGRWRYKCHGCEAHGDAADIEALHTGRPLAEVLKAKRTETPRRPTEDKPKRTFATIGELVATVRDVAAVYDYSPSSLRVIRTANKAFLQAHQLPDGRWSFGGVADPQPLYRGADLGSGPVIVTEGEKDADALRALGFAATTVPMGADTVGTPTDKDGKPGKANWSPLAGRDVVIWGDADEPGKRHGDRLARIIARVKPASLRRVSETAHKDAADLIAAHGDKAREAVEVVLAGAVLVEAAVEDGLVVLAADAVQAEDVRWLVPLWLAAGALSLVAGDPGVGKSFLSCEVAARASRGQTVLGQSIAGPMRVLLVNLEDHPGMVQRPRLEACGADLGNVLLLQEVRIGGKPAPVAVPRDVDLIERLVVQRGLSLVILDPISAMLHGVELNDMAQVRGALAPLEGMARRTGCAVLLIHHNRKAAAGSAQHRVGGSVAFTAAARTVWSVTVDGTDASRRLVHVSKSNLGKHPSGHAYTIDGEPGRVLWLGETAGSADDAAVAAGLDDGDREGVAWLRDALARGPVAASDIQRDAKAAGVDPRRLRQLGKRHLGMTCRKHGFDGPWMWALPPHSASSDSSQKHGASSADSREPCGFFVETPKKHEEARQGSQDAEKNDEEAPSISQEYEEVVISLRGS